MESTIEEELVREKIMVFSSIGLLLALVKTYRDEMDDKDNKRGISIDEQEPEWMMPRMKSGVHFLFRQCCKLRLRR